MTLGTTTCFRILPINLPLRGQSLARFFKILNIILCASIISLYVLNLVAFGGYTIKLCAFILDGGILFRFLLPDSGEIKFIYFPTNVQYPLATKLLIRSENVRRLHKWNDLLYRDKFAGDCTSHAGSKQTKSSAVAERPRNASCLSVVSFNIPTAQFFYYQLLRL